MTRRRLSCALILDPADGLMPTASPLAARRSPLAPTHGAVKQIMPSNDWKIFRSWAQLLPRIDIPAGR
ncbi:hypothetical protein LB542_27925 [Mesorhizobium sp. BR1-1-9]|uniref:hypothetical protein n=1 Tax=Mesorhizobium sp. BR1-1-9 TaxID=2876646 RepID=UPI001CD0F1C5|nr:hypothetical protein [Mesorhizobium sp. BR1-1-9]MBZ9874666.1 hypothetical protein [Mesorhizobium sp. BR1-1-9]